MHGHLLGSGCAPDSEIAERSLLAGESFFLRDCVPLAALRENGISKILPNPEREGDGGFPVELVFVFLIFFGQFSGEVLLRGLLCGLIPHGPGSR